MASPSELYSFPEGTHFPFRPQNSAACFPPRPVLRTHFFFAFIFCSTAAAAANLRASTPYVPLTLFPHRLDKPFLAQAPLCPPPHLSALFCSKLS